MFATVTRLLARFARWLRWLLARFAREKSMTSCFSTDSFCPWAASQNLRPFHVALMRKKIFFLCASLHIFKELSSAFMFISEGRSTSRRQPPCSQNRLHSDKKGPCLAIIPEPQRSCFLGWLPGFVGFPLRHTPPPGGVAVAQCSPSLRSWKKKHLFIPLSRRQSKEPEQQLWDCTRKEYLFPHSLPHPQIKTH